MNQIISWTQSNSRTCAYALTNDGAQFILACTASIMPAVELSLGFFPFLAHSHIFASSVYMTIFFYISGHAYVSSIVLDTFYTIVLLFLGECPTMCGIVDAGAYKLPSFVFPPTTTSHSNIPSTPQNPTLSTFGNHVAP